MTGQHTQAGLYLETIRAEQLISEEEDWGEGAARLGAARANRYKECMITIPCWPLTTRGSNSSIPTQPSYVTGVFNLQSKISVGAPAKRKTGLHWNTKDPGQETESTPEKDHSLRGSRSKFWTQHRHIIKLVSKQLLICTWSNVCQPKIHSLLALFWSPSTPEGNI